MELMGLSFILWIVGLVAAVMLFLMPFFVFRIRNELIELTRIHKRILVLVEAVVPDSKKPPTVTCNNCRTINDEKNERCIHCGERIFTPEVGPGQRSIIKKEGRVSLKICAQCGHRNEPLAAKCRKCGAEI